MGLVAQHTEASQEHMDASLEHREGLEGLHREGLVRVAAMDRSFRPIDQGQAQTN